MWMMFPQTTVGGYPERMTDSQRRRLIFGIILGLVGAVVANIGFQTLARDGQPAETSTIAAIGIGIILFASGAYLLIRFFQSRRG